jgi:nicotinate-nucleotide pyrophosphorylase (carboxylating)
VPPERAGARARAVPHPPESEIARLVDQALAEDIGQGDITSEAVVAEGTRMIFAIVPREAVVVAGLPLAAAVFARTAFGCRFEIRIPDGAPAPPGTTVATVEGNARGLLTGERTALNFLQHLSGIATLTRSYVERIEGTGAVLLDTRKTIPGMRLLAKYATALGGAQNHRLRLDEAVLIKDNHIAAAGGVAEAIRRAKAAGYDAIEIECESLAQVSEALAAGAKRILLDNMDLPTLRAAVKEAKGKAVLEASGGVRLETLRAIAETGVDYISVGWITHSAPAADIGLDLVAC